MLILAFIIEIALMGLVIYCMMHEEELIAIEERLRKEIKRHGR